MELPPLTPGRILRRYQRFLADVALGDGTRVTAHCPNTGSMTSCWQRGAPAELSWSGRATRKLPWTLERVDMGAGWVGVNTGRVNAVVAEGVARGRIPALAGYASLRREPRILLPSHPPSRFDLALADESGQPRVYVEVKNTTLLRGDAVQFPDAVSERGRKHLELLAAVVQRGCRGVIVFAVNRPEGNYFEPAWDIDRAWGDTLEEVVQAGVEIVIVRLWHTASGIETGGSVCYP